MSALSLLLICLPMTLAQFSLRPYDQTAGFIFDNSDLNHDGIMDRNELDLGFRHYDANRDGRVTYHEFTTFVHAQGHDPQTTHLLHAIYASYDENNDNQVDHVDFDRFFELSDYNGDGRVDRQEFVTYMSVLLRAVDNA